MNSRPVKINNALGDLQRFTAPEEDFVAYRASLRLANDDSSGVGQLSTLSGTSIGSFTDTFFNEAVGTHPGSSITTGSTVTTVYQRTGSDLDSADANFRTPINVNNVAGKIAEFSQAEWGDLANRLAKIIMTNEYPGTFRLGSSAPSGDYSVHLNNVFSDTQTDGTTVNYSIYKRATMTAPTKVNAMAIKRSAGPTGIYQGVQAMDSDQMTYSFGNHLKTWMMATSNNVGAYQIRSSAQGVPVASGTWEARGTATDTKKQTADQAYTTDYAGNYTGDYVGDFVGDFSGTYTINSTNDSTTDSTRTSTRNSTTEYIGNYTGDFVGTYTGDFTGNFIGNFAGNYVGDFIGDFTGDFIGNYEGEYLNPDGTDYTTDYISANYVGINILNEQYVGNFIGGPYLGYPAYVFDYESVRIGAQEIAYTGNYAGEYIGPGFFGEYTRNSTANFVRNDTNDSTRDSTRDSTNNSTRNQDENFTQTFTATYTGDFTGDYVGNFIGNFVGDFTGNFEGTYTTNSTLASLTAYEGIYTGNFLGETIQSSSETIETYTLYVRVA
jgi:outer membrane lipoprotein SlyB